MLENSKISLFQFGILVFVFTIGSSILLTPSGLASIAKQDAWIASLFGVGFSTLNIILFIALARIYPDNTYVECCEKILGKWVGKIVAASFVYFSFIGAAGLVYQVGNFMVTQIMPETPIEIINIVFALVILYGMYLGIEVIARTAEIFLPWMIFLLTLLILAVIPQMEMKQIQPIFEADLKIIFHGALTYTSYGGSPFVVFAMLIPLLNKKKKVGRTFVTTNILGAIIIVIITFMSISVLGADLTARSTFPSYVLAKKINIAEFLQRIEVIVAIIWFITLYIKIILYFYAAVIGTAQIFGLKDYRPLLFPFGLLLVMYSIIAYPNSAYQAEWDTEIWVPYSLNIGFFFPMILFVLSILRQKINYSKNNKELNKI